jgi:hypothetical protein
MSDAITKQESDSERAERIRIKWVTSILTTPGYGFIANTVVQPIASAVAITGHTFLGGAIYIAPRGEPK